VDVSNLQRQVAFGTDDIGQSKVDAAARRLRALNGDIEVVTHPVRLSRENAMDIMSKYDLVVDGSDNFATRYLVNDACVLLGKPFAFGAVYRFDGQVSLFHYKEGPCYRCVFPAPPAFVADCREGGVVGVLPGIIGSLQALEAIKVIVGTGDTLSGRLLLFDGLRTTFREIAVARNASCPACGDERTITELTDYDALCGTPSSDPVPEMSASELHARRASDPPIQLLDVREPHEREIANIGGLQIPLGELPERLGELDRDRDTVIYCRTGVRSALAVRVLRTEGFTNVWNLRGGIYAWSDEVDSSVTKY
jgi:molybdopterin/thiamine biosynthesis adenylyltransferase/rhodanese-related sulfurtransferase